MTNNKIYSELSNHKLKTSENFSLFGIAAQGSMNYDLSDNKSDIDSVAILLSSKKDVYNKKMQIINNNKEIEFISLYNVTDLYSLVMNSFLLEAFSSEFYIVDENLKQYWKDIKNLINELAYSNSSIIKFIFCNRIQYKCYNVERALNLNLIDNKDFHHILRLTNFLNNFYNGLNIENCFKKQSIYSKEYLMQIKRNPETIDPIKMQKEIKEAIDISLSGNPIIKKSIANEELCHIIGKIITLSEAPL